MTRIMLFLVALSAAAQQHVSFPTDDGGLIAADVYGKGNRGLVLAHGGRFTKESWSKQARTFADAGFRVVAIDFRGHGQSKRSGKNDPAHFDVLAAVRYLRKNGAKTVSIVGGSFGGGAGADAAVIAKAGEIDRLVMLGVGQGNFRPEKITCRKLLITTREDTSGSGLRLPGILDSFKRMPEPKKLVVLEGSAHAQFMFESDLAERVMREILEFLAAP